MTTHRDVPRTLAEKHARLNAELEQRAKTLLVDHVRQQAPDPTSPAGKRALRGIPVVGNNNALASDDDRRDPLLVILDREAAA